jgi:hypothetical protein
MLRTCEQDTLDLLIEAIKGDRRAFDTLMKVKKRPELAAFSNAIKGDEQAEIWLMARGGEDLQLVCKALNDDELAFKLLQSRESKFEISFVLACQKRIEGKFWLTKNNYSHFLPLCEAVVAAVNTKTWQKSIYRIF